MSTDKVIAEIERLGRQRKLTAEDSLYAAVANYINKHGGSAVVIGGIQVQQFPEDGELNYRVAVKCTGRKPEFSADAGRSENE